MRETPGKPWPTDTLPGAVALAATRIRGLRSSDMRELADVLEDQILPIVRAYAAEAIRTQNAHDSAAWSGERERP